MRGVNPAVRQGSTYRAARRNALRSLRKLPSPRVRAVEGPMTQMFRAWLMRYHHTHNAPPKPPCRVGPGTRSIVTIHLEIMKQRVRERTRKASRQRILR